MKWVVFGLALLSVVPLGLLLRSAPRIQPWLWMLVGLLPFLLLDALDINVVSFEHYRGDSRGIEITILDLVLLSLWIARPGSPPPASSLRIAYAVYLAAALVSVLQAAEPLFSWFSIWKLIRMYVVLHVVTAIARQPGGISAILNGAAVGLLCQGVVTLLQRYAFGFHQAPGLFAHQNSLGTAVCMVAPMLLSVVLVQPRRWLLAAGLAAGTLALILGLSRGALAIFAFAMALTLLISLLRGTEPRKLGIAALASLLAVAVLGKAADTIWERFESAPETSAEARDHFESAASQMLRDHPLGIGINQYSLTLLQEGYVEQTDKGQRAGDPEAPVYGGIAHNIYWLTAAELGYPGILAFAGLVLAPIGTALWMGWRTRGMRGDLLLGAAIGLVALWLHGLLEWTFRQTTISYLFFIFLGIISSFSALPASRTTAASQRRASIPRTHP